MIDSALRLTGTDIELKNLMTLVARFSPHIYCSSLAGFCRIIFDRQSAVSFFLEAPLWKITPDSVEPDKSDKDAEDDDKDMDEDLDDDAPDDVDTTDSESPK